MKVIYASKIEQAVYTAFLKANFTIPPDIDTAIRQAQEKESSPIGRQVLAQIIENHAIAEKEHIALCQDTGMAIIFACVGQELSIRGGNFEEAIHTGVRRAYQDGYLRKSVVDDPLYTRKNTADNTPAIIHTRIVPGETLTLIALPKGFGSENMSRIAMLAPSKGEAGVVDFVVQCVKEAMANPCPPVVVGVGIGGDFEYAALLSKKALARSIQTHHPDARYRKLETTLYTKINELGIGPAGTGGDTTCLGVNIETFPTHIASIPVAVNMCCHACRHKTIVLEGESHDAH